VLQFFSSSFRKGQGVEYEIQFLTQNGREILETCKSNTMQRRQQIDESPRSTPVNDECRDVTESSSSLGLSDRSRSRSCSGRSQTVSTTSTMNSEKYTEESDNHSERSNVSESERTLEGEKPSLLCS